MDRIPAKKGPRSADTLDMRKHMVRWKAMRCRNIYGETYFSNAFPELIDCCYRHELLAEIVSMVPQQPISFEEAVNLVKSEYSRVSSAGQIGSQPGQSHWYCRNFIGWISDQGYSIQLSGDEFEATVMCAHVS